LLLSTAFQIARVECPSQVSASYVRMKEQHRMDRRVIVEKEPCREGPQQKSWIPLPLTDWGRYKGGGWRSPKKVTGLDNPQ
jgi:hypothetical protein